MFYVALQKQTVTIWFVNFLHLTKELRLKLKVRDAIEINSYIPFFNLDRRLAALR